MLLKMDCGFVHPPKLGEQLKGFYCMAKEFDETFEILPFLSSDQKLQNIHSTHFNPNMPDLT